jgi:hypothetical protein
MTKGRHKNKEESFLKAGIYPVSYLIILFACFSVLFLPTASKAQMITDFVNQTGVGMSSEIGSNASDPGQVQQQLQKQLQTLAQLSQRDLQLDLQTQLQQQQTTEQELQERLQAIPLASSGIQQQQFSQQFQILQNLISLSPDQQEKFLQQEQQQLNMSQQELQTQQQLLQNTEQRLQVLQTLISLSPDQQKQVVRNLQQQLLQPTQQTQSIQQFPQAQPPQ